MKKIKRLLAISGAILVLTACGQTEMNGIVQKSKGVEQNEIGNEERNKKHKTVTVKASTDKYTWYIKDYVGKNIASFGYTSMGGDRMDRYGGGHLKLIFIDGKGTYIDIANEDELKKYMVAAQNLAPNTEMKYVFLKDEKGEEYDNLVESQTYEEIVLAVKEVGSSIENEIPLIEINPSPNKYTWYIRDYVGRNLASCGYLSMGGDLRDAYGASTIVFVITADDGSYIDVSDEEILKNYIVTGQDISPNTEMKLKFLTDKDGKEYDNLVESQNIEEIELYVSLVE